MVQVDVFWSYGIGAGFALAAFRQLRKLKVENEVRRWKLGWAKQGLGEMAIEPAEAGPQMSYQNHVEFRRLMQDLKSNGIKPGKISLKDVRVLRKLAKAWLDENSDAFNNEYFLKNLLFLSLLFVPSGAVLLWSNPSWETMQVGKYDTIPQWLVGIFTTTNVTQGILGFYNTYKAMMKGKYYQATMHTTLAYLGFFFILANGWDNKGYQRFFSKNREAFDDWSWSNIFGWARSDVAAILGFYGLTFMPLMIYWVGKWMAEGYKIDESALYEVAVQEDVSDIEIAATGVLGSGGVMAMSLGGAIMATALIRKLGWPIGFATFAATTALMMSKFGIGPSVAKMVMQLDSLEGPSVDELVQKAIESEKVLVGVS